MASTALPPGLRRLYARHAPRWHRTIEKLGYVDGYRRLALADLARRDRAPRDLLDAGCGTGAFAETYLDALAPGPAPQLTLLDPSDAMLHQARLRLAGHDPRWISGPLDRLAGSDARYDAILCAHVLEHAGELASGLALLAGALRPGGRLALAVSKPHWCTAILRWRWGHRAYRPDEVVRALARAGLTGIEVIPFRSGPPSRTSCGYLAQRPGGI